VCLLVQNGLRTLLGGGALGGGGGADRSYCPGRHTPSVRHCLINSVRFLLYFRAFEILILMFCSNSNQLIVNRIRLVGSISGLSWHGFIIIYNMNVGKCDLTLSTSSCIFCLIKMKATSQMIINKSFASLWGKVENFMSADFYIQSTLKLANEQLGYQKSPAEDRSRDPNLSYLFVTEYN
jgi:hypothetical protein